MGIRFICPECDKRLNVKTFLAGKKGFCPKCEAKISIPAESTIEPQKKAVSESVQTTASANKSSPVNPAELPPETQVASEAPAVSAPESAPEIAATSATVHAPIDVEIAKDSNSTAVEPTATTDAGADIPVPDKPVPDKEPENVSPSLLNEADGAPPENEAMGGVSAPMQDPIDAAPDSFWYVRPPTGGQFGPADGQRMKRWIEEGRISGESLVWREGWEDWQPANAVFPAFRASPASGTETKSAASSTPDAPEVGSTSGFTVDTESDSTVATNYHHVQRKSKTMGILALVGLAVVCVVLAIVLGIVLSSK